MAMVAQHWSLSALAVELGKDRRFVGKLLEGLTPASSDGRGPKYLMRDVVGAMTEGGDLDATQERARKDKALADKTEIQVLQMRDELLPSDEVARAWGDHITAARSRLLTMGATLGPQVAIESDVVRCRRLIDSQVKDALAELRELAIAQSRAAADSE